MIGRHRRGTWAIFVVAVASFGLGAVRAGEAQGLPMLPDPVSTPTLMGYADLLDLSPAQRLGLEPIHDAYLERFGRLREHEIGDFQERLIDVALRFVPNQFAIPPREDLEAVIEHFEEVLERIEAVDRSLFDRMETLLAEEQWLTLQRVRVRRRLEVLGRIALSFAGEMNPGASIDLTEMTRPLAVEPSAAAEIDLLLAAYERERLKKTEAMHQTLRVAATVVLDTIDQLRLRELTPEELFAKFADPEFQASLRLTFDEQSKPVQAGAYALSQHNLRTMRRLLPLYGATATAELRDRYHRRAFGGVYEITAWRARYAEALALEGLTPERAAQIRVERDRVTAQDDRLVDQLADAAEAGREYRSSARMDGTEPSPHQARIDDLRERRRKVSASAIATLDSMLGPELIAALDDETGERASEGQPGLAAAGGAGGGGSSPDAPASRPQPAGEEAADPGEADQVPPIPVADIGWYADRLGWDEEGRLVLETLYDDYRADFAAALERVEETPAPPAADEASEPSREDPRVDALRQIDERFFDDVLALSTEPGQKRLAERLRQMRRRRFDRELARALCSAVLGDDNEAGVDVSALVHRVDRVAPWPEAVDGVLDEYDATVAPLIRRRLDLARTVARQKRLSEKASARGAPEAVMTRLERRRRDVRSQWHQSSAELAEINRSHLERVRGLVSETVASELRYRYNRATHPHLYEPADRVEQLIGAATGLADLSAAQRERLATIQAAFRRRFFDLTDRMVVLRRQRVTFSGVPDRAMIEREIELEHLEFERDESEHRALLKVRLALTEAQQQMIPPNLARVWR